MTKQNKKRPIPSKQMLDCYKEGMNIYGIMHFGMNTFTNREWGFGDESLEIFKLKQFCPDKIVLACKNGGLK